MKTKYYIIVACFIAVEVAFVYYISLKPPVQTILVTRDPGELQEKAEPQSAALEPSDVKAPEEGKAELRNVVAENVVAENVVADPPLSLDLPDSAISADTRAEETVKQTIQENPALVPAAARPAESLPIFYPTASNTGPVPQTAVENYAHGTNTLSASITSPDIVQSSGGPVAVGAYEKKELPPFTRVTSTTGP